MKHRASLERMQNVCAGMVKDLEASKELETINSKLIAEVENLRFRLITQKGSDVPSDVVSQWESMKTSLV